MKVFLKVTSVLYQGISAITNDFNHLSENYVNFIAADSSAQMMSTQNDDQNSGR